MLLAGAGMVNMKVSQPPDQLELLQKVSDMVLMQILLRISKNM